MSQVIVYFVDLLVSILYIALIIRVILSWLPMGANNPVTAVIYQITEPVLAPLRRLIPRIGLLDITPMVALILLSLIQWAVHQAL